MKVKRELRQPMECAVYAFHHQQVHRGYKKRGGGGERFETKAAVVPDCGRGMYVEVGLFFFFFLL